MKLHCVDDMIKNRRSVLALLVAVVFTLIALSSLRGKELAAVPLEPEPSAPLCEDSGDMLPREHLPLSLAEIREGLKRALSHGVANNLTVCDVASSSANLWGDAANAGEVGHIVEFVNDMISLHSSTSRTGSDASVPLTILYGPIRTLLVDPTYISNIRCDIVVYVPHANTNNARLEIRRLRSLAAANAVMMIPQTNAGQHIRTWGVKHGYLHNNIQRLSTDRWTIGALISKPLYSNANLDRAVANFGSASLDELNTLSSVLTDYLHAFLNSLPAEKFEHLEGHSAQIVYERKLYSKIAAIPEIKTICEIGFNGGHSASLWLAVNPKATVHMFDLWQHGYAAAAEKFLRTESAEHGIANADSRLFIHKGSSLEVVPRFARDHPDVKCDLLSVDGGHTYEIAKADLLNMRKLANPKFHVAVIDDTNCGAHYCVDRAFMDLEDEQMVRPFCRLGEVRRTLEHFLRGITVFQYNL